MKLPSLKLKHLVYISLLFVLIFIIATAIVPFFNLFTKPVLYVAFGDSLAQGYPYYLQNNSYSYTDCIYNELDISRPSNLKFNYINYGTTGFTSSDLLNQISDAKVSQNISKAKIITLNIGGNDMLKAVNKYGLNDYELMLTSIDSYSDNLVKTFARLRTLNPDTHIYIANIFNPLTPGDKSSNYKETNYLLSYLNKIIYNNSSPYNIKVIDISPVFKGHEYGIKASWFYDKIHPNQQGYSAMSKPFIDCIKQDLKVITGK